MLLEINFSSEVPIYEQIRREIVKGIACKKINAGETLPSVRQFAEDLGVNLHTVNKAYKLLQQDGFIEMDRRFGTKVVDDLPKLKEETRDFIEGELSYLVSILKATHTDINEVIGYIENIYKGGD